MRLASRPLAHKFGVVKPGDRLPHSHAPLLAPFIRMP
jgi:hypothetical protein